MATKTKKVIAKPVGGTSGAGGDKSNTRTATETSTSTEAYTQGNVTVTGGAGAGDTSVYIGNQQEKPVKNDPAHQMFLKNMDLEDFVKGN